MLLWGTIFTSNCRYLIDLNNLDSVEFTKYDVLVLCPKKADKHLVRSCFIKACNFPLKLCISCMNTVMQYVLPHTVNTPVLHAMILKKAKPRHHLHGLAERCKQRSGKPQRDVRAGGRKRHVRIDMLTEGRCGEMCRWADRQLTRAVASNGEVSLTHEASLSPILTDFHPVNV